jgi:RHS repeat-associated protein
VMVNGGAADRHGEYFHREISVSNTNQPIWQNVTNIAGTFTNTGGSVFPANGQALVYDADGNLSSDGIWSYHWDAENRLISMTMTNISGIANSNRLQIQFAYDYMGRRVQKIVSTLNGSGFLPQSTNLFIYDGWNLLAVVNPQSSILQSFMWGQDLSGTINKAGGVGGLLMASISGTNCFATFDGNGNITALINASDKSLAARYEYSPYGELLRETGMLAHQNPFRFSTKFWDDESGLVYYSYRYYCPTIGRWINRDPSGEKGGIHLYLFVKNSPIGTLDSDGQYPTTLEGWYLLGVAAEYGGILLPLTSPLPVVGNPYVSACVGVKLDVLKNIGQVAFKIMAGDSPPRGDDVSTGAFAYDFVQEARHGQTAEADLDAVLFAYSLAQDENNDMQAGLGAFSDGLEGISGFIANEPEYKAIIAWADIDDTEGSLDGAQ